MDKYKSDATWRSHIRQVSEKFGKLQAAKRTGENVTYELGECVQEILRSCNYNPTFLAPYLFPKYPKNKPLSFLDRVFASMMMSFIPQSSITARSGRQIGKSVGFGGRMRILTHLIPYYQIGYITPASAQRDTFAQKFLDMERGFRFPVRDTKYTRQNILMKKYPNGSLIELMYAYTTADNIRGKSFDECVYVGSSVSIVSDNGLISHKKLSTLSSNDSIISYTEGTARKDSVVAYKSKGLRQCWQILTEKGDKLICTANHRLGTSKGWLYVADIIGDDAASIDATVAAIRESNKTQEETSGKENYLTDRDIYVVRLNDAGSPEYTKIVSVTYAGILEVGDVQVKENENFFANNLLVHNCFFDEYQDMDRNLELDITSTLSDSKYKIRIYAGTSKTIDTALEARWQESCQLTPMVKSADGSRWINLCDPEDIKSILMPDGPRCPVTRRLLNMNEIQYIAANREAELEGRYGIHASKICIPIKVMNEAEWLDIYSTYKSYTWNKFLEETCGIPTEEGLRELTEQDLINMCVLGSKEDGLRRAQSNYYRFIVGACDWGGSDYNPAEKTKLSYTAHTIIGVTNEGDFHLLHFELHAGMAYARIAQIINQTNQQYRVSFMSGDFGGSGRYETLFREMMRPHSFFLFKYQTPYPRYVGLPTDSYMQDLLCVSKDESLTDLFDMIKGGRIKCYNYEQAKEYLTHFRNSYRVRCDSSRGPAIFTYRKHGSKADDCLHSTNFGIILARLLNHEMLNPDRGTSLMINNLLRGVDPHTGQPSEYDYNSANGLGPDNLMGGFTI